MPPIAKKVVLGPYQPRNFLYRAACQLAVDRMNYPDIHKAYNLSPKQCSKFIQSQGRSDGGEALGLSYDRTFLFLDRLRPRKASFERLCGVAFPRDYYFPDSIHSGFHVSLEWAISQRKMTMRQLALKMGANYGSVYGYLKYRQYPNLYSLCALLWALEFSLTEFFMTEPWGHRDELWKLYAKLQEKMTAVEAQIAPEDF